MNAIIGGIGHNYLHRLDPRSLALDWNGLSTFEWLLEHVVSHHPFPNSPHDHDSISMLPFVSWLRPGLVNCMIFPVFFVGEVVVALHGCFGHRCRWHATDYDLPRWIKLSPWMFVCRCILHVCMNGWYFGVLGLMISMLFSSFYFSFLAHLNHAPVSEPTDDFLHHQLNSTVDLKVFNTDVYLGLDRQTLHHLFPSMHHSHLNKRVRHLLKTAIVTSSCTSTGVALEQHSILHLCRHMFQRLFG
jgi:hypothetical protein